ncbi:iron transporter [Stutzerimonas urumqiensis]|uniref:iron transporter n=1 Tax=Stutzerimonas urumqiensis TaxID=638269 RepID=UPI003BAB94A3
MARTAAKDGRAWQVLLLRIVMAVFGGYAFTYAATATLARLLPFDRYDAAAIAMLASFVVYLTFVLWALTTRSGWRVLLGVMATLPLAAIGFWPQLLEGLR